MESRLAENISEKIPLSVESDVYPATAAELLVRHSLLQKPIDNDLFPFFYLTISTGVGGEQAIIDDNTWKIYRNQNGVTEVGHDEFKGDAPNLSPIRCDYKGFDCAETYLGGKLILGEII